MTPKLLTKSRLKVALKCPTKLYYLDKEEYVNNSLKDTFLQALAEGGFQVGALAKCYYSDKKDEKGTPILAKEVEEKDYDKAVEETNDLLKNENVIIFEAAFKYKDFFVRTDILEKIGKNIRVIEVKSKSFDPNNSKKSFVSERAKFIRSGWVPYMYDIAFQNYVVVNSFFEKKQKDFNVSAYLMLADQSKCASIDGLNQKFLVKRDNDGKPKVEIIGDVSKKALGDEILIEVPVEDCLKLIYESEEGKEYLGEILYYADYTVKKKDRVIKKIEFEKFIDLTSKNFKQNKKINSPLGKICKTCEYKLKKDEKEGKENKSGFNECWAEKAKFKKKDFDRQLVYDVWFYLDTDAKFSEEAYFMDELEKEDLKITGSIEGHPLIRNERQWLQVEKYQKKDNTPYIYLEGLKAELKSWIYPLHFIDFETTSVALPFNKKLKPYEGIAFQYSHHIVKKDGTIEHKGEFINDKIGKFPNYNFVRALKNELDKDEGSIFRYAAHENTYLNIIYQQLIRESIKDVPDKLVLMDWIKSITNPTESTGEEWSSPRNMIDMKDIVLKYYYSPLTNGSNSIKQVLPAVLNSSKYLQDKYSKPIYGASNIIKSLNYKDWVWIRYNDDKSVKDPYKILPPIFNENDDELLDKLYNDDKLQDGGAAMTAYAKMQFTRMLENERETIRKALLRYCELDTFAMVLIWEYWNEIVK